MRRSAPLLLLAAITQLACAHVRTGSKDELDHQVDLYFKALRWKDFHAAAALVSTERRAQWRRARIAHKDEQDLSVTSFDIEEERLSPETGGGHAFVKVTWVRLPSVVERTDEVEQRWEYREHAWLLVSEEGGPFGDAAGPVGSPAGTSIGAP